jgi:hypothetical protein
VRQFFAASALSPNAAPQDKPFRAHCFSGTAKAAIDFRTPKMGLVNGLRHSSKMLSGGRH